MKIRTPSKLLLLAVAGLLSACGDDDGTGPDAMVATVQGSIEETTPTPAGPGNGPAAAPGTDADMVAVVQIGANGSITTVAEAPTAADASYAVDSVAAGLDDLAVVTYVGTREAGRVLLYQSSTAGETLDAAPINYETTAEGRAWTEMRGSGDAGATSAGEVSLLLHFSGPEAEALLASETEIEALADGLAVAGETLTSAYAELGIGLDAQARADIIQEAAVVFAESRAAGTALDEAHDSFAESVLEGFVESEATLEETAAVTAAAASMLDATVEGRIASRGLAIAEAVRLNLRARERLVAEYAEEGAAYAELAGAIQDVLVGSLGTIRGSADAAAIRAELDANRAAVQAAATTALVEILAAEAPLSAQGEVATAVRSTLSGAQLSTRLEGAADDAAAAQAVSDYSAGVLSGVQAMIQAAAEAGVGVDAEAELLTALFVAASAGPYVR